LLIYFLEQETEGRSFTAGSELGTQHRDQAKIAAQNVNANFIRRFEVFLSCSFS